MRINTLAAVAAVLVGLTPGLAIAQHRVVTERTVVRGPAPRMSHSRKVCETRYRHHHRVRICRTVRYR